MRTPLTYYGGKMRLAAQIASILPPHRVYLEPFAGGAAVLFAKPPAAREILNDLDSAIVRFWRVLRERPLELAAAIAATPYARSEWEASAEHADDDLEAARRLLVNVHQSFGRSRRSWSNPGTSPNLHRWQPAVWLNLPPKVAAAAERLAGVALENTDALELIPRHDRPGTLIYCDPPYAGDLRTARGNGYAHDDPDLWSRLVPILAALEHADVILSGYPCQEVDELGWPSVRLTARRTVGARDGAELDHAPEHVWLSPRVRYPTLFAP